MNTSSELSKKIETHLLGELKLKDPEAQVKVKSNSLGLLKIEITTHLFEEEPLEEREKKIDDILEYIELNLGQYPIYSYHLLTPQELKESPEDTQLPLWSDILMSPEPNQPVQINEDIPKRPLVVTFYSFKGGVGRSTVLGLVASILASRNRRVVMVDFDLEAPGISILFRSDIENFNSEQYGVLDYLHQRCLTPDQNVPSIESCILKVNLQARGELFLVSSGEYNENYIHRLAELDRQTLANFYHREINPVNQLMVDIKNQLDPDIILIDARPGFNDTSAIALFDLANTAIICFSPTDQSFEGLRWVVQSVRKRYDYYGKPDIRFLLTPMPVVAPEQRQTWITRVEDWIEENWGLPSDTTVGELYSEIPYNASIMALSSLINIPTSLLNDYQAVADIIDASLPDIKPNLESILVPVNRQDILNELKFEAPTAQEIEADNIPDIFHRTEDFPEFLSNKNWLIRGAKGTGKSLLFRLFVEKPEKAKDLAQYEVNLRNVHFLAAHGQPRLKVTILNSLGLADYEKQVNDRSNWAIFWLSYALLQLCHDLPDLRSSVNLDERLIELSKQDNPLHAEIVQWLVHRSQSPQAKSQAVDELRIIDQWLQNNHQVVWLLYDELDAGFGSTEQDYNRRRQALEALLAWWLEIGTSLKCIVPKIFLREDIWNQLNFTNKGHYSGRSLQLRWDEADLWRLVLRQALKNSQTMSNFLENKLGVTVERLNAIELEQLRTSLYTLWGERMGRTKKAYTCNWVRTRIADGKKNCFPRSLVLLLQEAVKNEKNFPTEYSSDIVLRPKALIDAFPYVSEQRVDEVRNEYPELQEYLEKLQNERSPIDETRLSEIWNLKDVQLATQIRNMIDAGIFIERSRPKDPPPRMYTVVELYLYGLNMVRKGQR